MSYEAWNTKLTKLREMLDAGQAVWWSREPFHKEPYKDVDPKWHLFKGRAQKDPQQPGVYVWRAPCGYTWTAVELLLSIPRLKLSKGKPTRARQCAKCAKQAAK